MAIEWEQIGSNSWHAGSTGLSLCVHRHLETYLYRGYVKTGLRIRWASTRRKKLETAMRDAEDIANGYVLDLHSAVMDMAKELGVELLLMNKIVSSYIMWIIVILIIYLICVLTSGCCHPHGWPFIGWRLGVADGRRAQDDADERIRQREIRKLEEEGKLPWKYPGPWWIEDN